MSLFARISSVDAEEQSNVSDNQRPRQSSLLIDQSEKTCVCETLCPGGNLVQKAILALMSKSRSQGNCPWCHLKGYH